MADQSLAVSPIRPEGRLRDGGLARLWAFPPGAALVVGLLLALCWLGTYAGGGAGKVPPHFFYVPIMVAASRFGLLGAGVTALVSGILAGPLMPLDVQTGTSQALLDWGSRTGFFLGIGLLMAVIISRRNRAERDRAAREVELEALRAIDLSILGVAPFSDTLVIARDALGELVPAERMGLVLVDPGGEKIRRVWVNRGEAAHDTEEELPISGPIARALEGGAVVAGLVQAGASSWESGLARDDLRSFLVVPLVADRVVMGTLNLASRRPGPFRQHEVGTASRIAGQLAIALRAGQLAAQLEKHAGELEAIRVVSEAVGASLDLGLVLGAALEHSLEVTGLDVGGVSLLEEKTGDLVLAAERNLPEPIQRAASRVKVETSTLGRVVLEGRALIVPDVGLRADEDARDVIEASGRRPLSIVAAPLIWEAKTIGVITLGSLDDRVPDGDDLSLLEGLARPIASAIGNAKLFASLRQSQQERGVLLQRLLTAEEEERKRIAADIHDDSIQVITSAGMRLDLLRRHLTEPEDILRVSQATEAMREAVARLRHLLFELHPPELDREGLVPLLRAILADFEEEVGVTAGLDARLSAEPPTEVRAILYRIAREALANVRKHARARTVTVRIEDGDEGVSLRVEDDGVGFAQDLSAGALPGHLGLPTMRERAEMAGGWCQVRSTPGEGTAVEAWVPVLLVEART